MEVYQIRIQYTLNRLILFDMLGKGVIQEASFGDYKLLKLAF